MFYLIKKKIHTTFWYILFAVIGGLVSCKKESTDLKELYVYTPTGNTAYNVLSGGVISILGNKTVDSINTSFPVFLTRAFDKNVEVTASIDTTLVKVYDSLYKKTTPSLVPPNGAFGLGNGGKVTIVAGETSSQDSLYVVVLDGTKVMTGTNTYIVPIVLNAATNGIPTSATRQVMYVQLKVVSIATGITSTTGTNAVNITLNNINGVNTGQSIIYLLGALNNAIGSSLSIAVQEDTGLIKAYNATNGTNYQAFPTGSYVMTKTSVTVPANAIVSKDSFAVSLSKLNAFSVGTDYLLPIRIADNGNQGILPIDQTKNIVYIHVNAFVNNIDPSNSGLTGTTMSRSSWTATASSSYYEAYYSASNAIDGNNGTDWIGNGVPSSLQIDMGSVSTVKGFNVTPDVYDDVVQIEVSSSQDGVTWKREGTYNNLSPSETPEPKTLKFVNPVTARYFKFNITATYYQVYAGMTELIGIQ